MLNQSLLLKNHKKMEFTISGLNFKLEPACIKEIRVQESGFDFSTSKPLKIEVESVILPVEIKKIVGGRKLQSCIEKIDIQGKKQFTFCF